jgi:DNA transposition AAA+ family ATPase
MTNEQKQQIVDAANAYASDKDLSQNELSRKVGINPGYLSPMLKGNFFANANGTAVEIGGQWFQKLAEFIGFSTKKTYWETLPTRQHAEITTALFVSMDTQDTAMLIGETRCGKSNAIGKFVNKFPAHTYVLTVSNLYKKVDIINELAEKVGIEYGSLTLARVSKYSEKVRVDKIVEKLKDIRRSGGKPVIIFDEGENLEMPVLKTIKALYDALKDECGIVLIGTDQLLERLLNLRKRGRQGIPQLYSRFKPGLRQISSIKKEKDFVPFFDKYVSDVGLRDLLLKLCDNYGELNKYLERAVREADQKNVPLTETFFRKIFNLPK